MMDPKHKIIIDEIMAGKRILPPLKDRIRIRDEHLAKTHGILPKSNELLQSTAGPEIDYETRRSSGD